MNVPQPFLCGEELYIDIQDHNSALLEMPSRDGGNHMWMERLHIQAMSDGVKTIAPIKIPKRPGLEVN
jgi:hypothetical protein